MDYRSEDALSSASPPIVRVRQRQRRHFRQKIQNLAYINLDHANGGIIRNVSESGIAVQVVSPVEENQQVHLRFELLNPRTRVEASGRVAWTDSSGQAGLEFVVVGQRSRRQLREWLFTQLLGTAAQLGAEAIFVHRNGQPPAELVFSGPPRPPVQVVQEQESDVGQSIEASQDATWYPFADSPRTLARVVDILVVAAAVLLFCVVSLAMTQVFPAWWLGFTLILATSCIFALVYRLLFISCVGITPGSYLVHLTGALFPNDNKAEPEDAPRFR
ncbi:MAG TPA: PilZ domain-containing protein [Terriglobales bacterium]|jgi:hypothetical protein